MIRKWIWSRKVIGKIYFYFHFMSIGYIRDKTTNFIRKQILLLEENVSNTEKRLRDDAQCMSDAYAKTVEQLSNEKLALITGYEAKITQLENNYSEALTKLKTHHLQELEDIQKEHRNMIENIRFVYFYVLEI